MASQALISWSAPSHLYVEKKADWYWVVGIISVAIAVTCFLFGEFITGIFVIVAALVLMLHASRPPHVIEYEVNDRGIALDDVLYPFVGLESFWIPHDEEPPRLLVKPRQSFTPLMVIYIDGVDPEKVRSVLLKYIAETEHSEPLLKKLMEALGL